MKLRNRFLLIGLGVVLFSIIAPILVFYARGFQFDWKTGQIIKTGALVVRTQPDNAEIYLNGVKNDNLTPTNIRFLLPDDYTITIKKDNYKEWTKRLAVRSQLVTWVNDNREFVTLFLKQPILENTINSQRTYNAYGNSLLFRADDKLLTLNTDSAESDLFNSSALPDSLMDKIIWKSFDNRGQNINKLNLLDRSTIDSIDEIEVGGDHIVARISDRVYLMQPQGLTLIDSGSLDITLENNEVWILKSDKLISKNLNTLTDQTIKNNLPVSEAGEIIRTPNFVFTILNGNVYMLNEQVDLIYSRVKKAYWNNAADKLVISNDNEILTYNPKTQTLPDLIVRTLSNISNIRLNSETGFVFFVNDGKIKAVELDGRDNRNTYEFIDSLEGFELTDSGKKLINYSDSEINVYTIR